MIIWVNQNISLIWNKVVVILVRNSSMVVTLGCYPKSEYNPSILMLLPFLTIIPVRSQWGYNLPEDHAWSHSCGLKPYCNQCPEIQRDTSLMAVLRRLFHASLALGWTQIIGISSFKTFKKGELWLVGGFNPSEKYESVGMIIPNIWKTCSKPPTRW